MQNENNIPLPTRRQLGPALKVLTRYHLPYSIHGSGAFVFAFWRTGQERTHFVLTRDLVEYSQYFNFYLAAQARGECEVITFDTPMLGHVNADESALDERITVPEIYAPSSRY